MMHSKSFARLFLSIALLGLCLSNGAAASDELSARDIMERATEAAGGDAWRYATSNLMTGDATLYRGNNGVKADRYEMRRVYPRELPEVHTSTGLFRLDAYQQDRLLFTMSYDGNRMHDQNGPMSAEQAQQLAASSFGFSAVRFALDDAFALSRLPDDQVEGHASYFVRIDDPSGGNTLVGVDKDNYLLRYVGWQTPRGWHHRLYSNHYELESGFVQPGRVRLYYDGVKTTDINWTSATLNVDFPDGLFTVAGSRDLAELAGALQGSYRIDPEAAAADNDVPLITSHFAPLDVPALGDHVVYWQMNTGESEELYRQVIMVFTIENGTIRQTSYSLNDAEKFADGHQQPEIFQTVTMEDLRQTLPAGCDLYWSKDPTWHGKVITKNCKLWSERRQAYRYIGTEIVTGSDALLYVERGFDANNQRLFGPPEGEHYRMQRLDGINRQAANIAGSSIKKAV